MPPDDGFHAPYALQVMSPPAGAAADLRTADLAALKAGVARIEANLVDLFGKLGYKYECQAPKVRKQRRGHG
jgi:hypothetical protein